MEATELMFALFGGLVSFAFVVVGVVVIVEKLLD